MFAEHNHDGSERSALKKGVASDAISRGKVELSQKRDGSVLWLSLSKSHFPYLSVIDTALPSP